MMNEFGGLCNISSVMIYPVSLSRCLACQIDDLSMDVQCEMMISFAMISYSCTNSGIVENGPRNTYDMIWKVPM